MRPNHILLAILTAAIWGSNFVFVSLALIDMPPYLLCTLRFVLTALPAVFFLPKPAISFKLIFAYGLFTFALQFVFLFGGLSTGMPPGLTSLVFQSQVFMSIFLAAFFLKEMPSPLQIIGGLVALIGLGIIWSKHSEGSSLAGFLMIIAAALSMATGNLLARKLAHANPYSLVAWGSLVSLPPLLLWTLYSEGSTLIVQSLQHISGTTLACIAFTAYISTWVAYTVWNKLLHDYTVAAVIPFMLLVPMFGMLGAHLAFDEPMQSWKILAAAFIISGLGINVLGSRLMAMHQKTLAQAESDVIEEIELQSE